MKYHYFKMCMEMPSALKKTLPKIPLKSFFLEGNQENFSHFLRVVLHLLKTFFLLLRQKIV